jgi:hypothetical protein
MTEVDPLASRGLTARQMRDLAALVLLVVGVIGLVVCAFVFDVLLGWAVASAASIAVGVALGYERSDAADDGI